MALGLIPTWQFSADWRTNPSLNPFVPSSPAWRRAAGLSGCMGCAPRLGYVMVDANHSVLGPRTLEELVASGAVSPTALGGVTDLFRAGGWIADHKTELIVAGVGLGLIGLFVLR